MVRNICDSCALQNRLEQCISDKISRRKRAAGDMFFELLRYGALLSRTDVDRVITSIRGKWCDCCAEMLFEK